VVTQLSLDMADSEFSIPNYQVIRLDCNRHGGVLEGLHRSLLTRKETPIDWALVSQMTKLRHCMCSDTTYSKLRSQWAPITLDVEAI